MKNTNKKAFTIVELVIVIAVIGILSAVLIPTFSGLVSDAQNTAFQENLNNAYKEYYINNFDKTDLSKSELCFAVDGVIYAYNDQKYMAVTDELGAELLESSADENGYVLLGTYNNIKAYYKPSTPLTPSSEEEVLEDLIALWEWAIQNNIGGITASSDPYFKLFGKLVNDTYQIYTLTKSGEDYSCDHLNDMTMTLEEVEDEFLNIYTHNGYAILT